MWQNTFIVSNADWIGSSQSVPTWINMFSLDFFELAQPSLSLWLTLWVYVCFNWILFKWGFCVCAGCDRHLPTSTLLSFHLWRSYFEAVTDVPYLFININITQRNKIMTKGVFTYTQNKQSYLYGRRTLGIYALNCTVTWQYHTLMAEI